MESNIPMTPGPMATSTAPSAKRAVTAAQVGIITAIVAVASVGSELIGNVSFPVGITKVTLFPFLWALLLCVGASILMKRMDSTGLAYIRTQTIASDFDVTVAELIEQLSGDRERLAKVLAVSTLLVDGQAARARTELVPAGAQVDVLPPFAGG